MLDLKSLKKFAKKRYSEFAENQKLRNEYQKTVNKAVTEARQKAYLKQAVIEAKKKAQQQAKMKFNPPQTKSNLSGISAGTEFAINFGMPKQPKTKKIDPLKDY